MHLSAHGLKQKSLEELLTSVYTKNRCTRSHYIMFSKNILIVDLETTGLDVHRHEIIQIAAVLLDKKSLTELKHFNSFVKPRFWKRRDPEAMAVNKIEFNQLAHAPTLFEAIKKFRKAFAPSEVIVANYGGILDITFLRKAFESGKFPYTYDYHIFNIWALCYAYMSKYGRFSNTKKFPGFGLEDLAKKFKLQSQTHDALDDCRLEADVMRHILKHI